MKRIIFVLILIIVTSSSYSTIRYVSKNGKPMHPYTSWKTASDSIQKCMNICNPGDTVYLDKGVYIEKIIMKNKTSLIGIDRDSSIIDTRTIVVQQSFYAISMGDSCLIENLHLIVSGSNQKDGIAISTFNKNFAIVKKNLIENAWVGIEISFVKKSVIHSNLVVNCDRAIFYDAPHPNEYYAHIFDNYCLFNDVGIINFYDGNTLINNNFIIYDKNTSEGIYIGLVNGSFKVRNNLVVSLNQGYLGINYGSNDTLFNNIVVGVGTSVWIRRPIPFYNNVIIDGIKGIRNDSSNSIIKYNAFHNNELNLDNGMLDSTNIVADPMFVNRTKDSTFDGHLQKYSPLIDAGDPTILDVDGSRSDIGLYGGPYGESYTYIDYAPHVPHNITSTIVKKNITINWNMNTEADFSHYEVYLDTTENFTADSTRLIALVDTNNYWGVRSFEKSTYYRILAVDNQGNKSVLSEPVSVIVTGVDEPIVKGMDYMLYNAYPNPFNPSTTIAYRLKEDGYVKLSVYDIKGELVEILVNGVLPKGYYQASFSPKNTGKDLASGIYIYRIDIRNNNNIPVFSDMKKMILMK
ncbi:MAG TPA: T9SS type A sorting domain-containing protein [Ignavibacteriaceae bacterium]|nr:T9SS type A sorting domain-containing protein [Ignavibacteriaceae bacterium]